MSVLILAMPRSQSTRLYYGLQDTKSFTRCFYEPGSQESWEHFSFDRVATLSEESYREVDEALDCPDGRVLVKVVPIGLENPLSVQRLRLWARRFDQVIFIDRPFLSAAPSFFLASIAQEWIHPTSHCARYEETAHRHILERLFLDRLVLRQWRSFFSQVTSLTHTEVSGYMERHHLLTSTAGLSEVPYASRIENYEEFMQAAAKWDSLLAT